MALRDLKGHIVTIYCGVLGHELGQLQSTQKKEVNCSQYLSNQEFGKLRSPIFANSNYSVSINRTVGGIIWHHAIGNPNAESSKSK